MFIWAAFKGLSLLMRAGLIVGVIAAGWGAWEVKKWSLRKEGQIAALEKVAKATKAESDRRMVAIDLARTEADRLAIDLAAADARNAALLQEVADASARNDGNSCLDVDSVRRLGRIGGGRKAGARTPLPPRRPAL
jgi:hypothetical protein